VDGTGATGDPAGYSFPVMTFNLDVKEGVANTVAGDVGTAMGAAGDPAIYLPRLATDSLTLVSGGAPITVATPTDAVLGAVSFAPSRLNLTIQPSTIVGANGSPLASPSVGVVPVPISIVQALPPDLAQDSFMVAIEAPGATAFTGGASLTLPNVLGLSPGQQTVLFSLDPATGQMVVDGTATASADGQAIVTDPTARIAGPGLYGVTPAASNGVVTVGVARKGAPVAGYEASANQSVLPLVTSANAAVALAIAPTSGGSGMIGGTGLAFANAVGIGSNVTAAIAAVNADAQAIRGLPTAPIGCATLAADALHAAINISAALGATLPGPITQWSSGLPAARQYVTALQGITGAYAGARATVDAMVKAAKAGTSAAFDAALAGVNAEAVNQVGMFQRIVADLSTLSALDGLDLTQSGLGVTAGQLATLNEQLPAIVNAFDDYMSVAQQLAGHQTVLGLADQFASALSTVESQTNAAAFQAIAAPTSGLADNGLGAPAHDIETTMYAAIESSDGGIQRLGFTAGQGFNFFAAPATTYRVTVFDPATNSTGQSLVRSGASGQTVSVPMIGLAPDPAVPGADGLTATEAFVIGVNNATASNLAPGIADLAALREGFYHGTVTPGATGIVASVPLLGNAREVVLAGASDGATTYAYVATGGRGLSIVDVTNPDAPVVLGQLAPDASGASGVAVSGDLGIAAVATGGSLALFDVANPAAPRLVQTIPIGTSAVAIIGQEVYVASGSGLASFDLTTGTATQSLDLRGAGIVSLAVTGATIYTMDAGNKLRVIDTSTGTMVAEGSLQLPAGGVGRIFAAGDTVYAGAANNANTLGGYLTVDVSNPFAPTLIAGASNTAIAGATLAVNGSGTGVSVQQLNSANLLSVFNAANPANTGNLISQFTLASAPLDVKIGHGVGFVADGASGLAVANYLPADATGTPPVISAVSGLVDVDPGTAGTQVFAGAPITVTPTVADNVQVRDVELLLNGGVVTSAGTWPFALTATMPTVAGTATLQVEAIDTGGNATLSQPIAVQIVPDTRAFGVIDQNVTQGATLRPSVHSITLEFSKPVNPASITASTIALLAQGGVVAAESMTLSERNDIVSLNFGTLTPGSYQLVINAPRVVDDNGGALGSGTITTSFTIEQFTAIFSNTGNGDWSTAGNWNTGTVPGATDSVSLGGNGQTVSYNTNDTVTGLAVAATGTFNIFGGGLTVSDLLQANGQVAADGGGLSVQGSVSVGTAGAILINDRGVGLNNAAIASGGSIEISNNNWLFASGTYANAGLIGLNSIGNDTRMLLSGNLSLTNSGTVQFSDNGNNFISSNAGAVTLTNNGNLIEGSGQIGDGNVSIDNAAGGTIDATGTHAALILQSGNDFNAGLIEDTGPAGLLLRSASITGLGTIAAMVTNSVVSLQSASITGGTLQDANGGVIQEIDRGSVINNVTLASGSNLNVTNNNWLYAAGTLTNNGSVLLNSVGNDTRVLVQGSVTLAGTGVLQLTDNGNNFITSNGNAAFLTNASNTIAGSGQIGDGLLSFNNEAGGTIDATGNAALIIQSGNNTNSGLMEATGPGGLLLRSASITGPGTIAADVANSVVNLQSAGITGGTLRDANGGVIQEIDRGSLINNVTLATASNLNITNNNWLYATGTFTNNGTVLVSSRGNDTRMLVQGSVTLTGAGAIQLSDNPVNFITSNGNAALLINVDNTIEGAGQIGDGPLSIDNEAGGTIDATGGNALIVQSGNNTNAGLMEAAGPGGLLLRSASITGPGTIAATGTNSVVNVQSAVITGGTLRDDNGGTIQETDRGGEIIGVTLATNSNLHVTNNNWLYMSGSIVNDGSIFVDSRGNDTRLIALGGVTLAGGGLIQLSDNGNNLISGGGGSSLINVNNTIQGSGQIGDGLVAISNGAGGTIDATGAGAALVLTGLPFTNIGLMEATGPAGLLLRSTSIVGPGIVAAVAQNAVVNIQSALITGGTLQTANGGVIRDIDRGSAINNVTLAAGGDLHITNNSYLFASGSFVNEGSVFLDSAGNDTRLFASGTVTLTGGGLIRFSDNPNNTISATGSNPLLINQDNLIEGGGQIGDGLLSMINQGAGIIDASDGNALRIVMSGRTLTNFGTIEATSTTPGNAGLQIISSTIDNSGSNNAGVILANGTNSHVNIASSAILGGTLVTANGGVFQEVDRSGFIGGVTLNKGGALHVVNDQFLTIGGSLVNQGTLFMDSVGNDTRIIASGSVTLTGTGAVHLSDNPNNLIGGGGGSVLTNLDNTISGSGQIGDGNLIFNNAVQGTVNATGAGAALVLGGGVTMSNAGLLEGTGPTALRISTTINNVGTIAAPVAGSHVDLASATINGGILSTANGGVIQAVDRGSALNGVTIAAGATVAVLNSQYLALQGVVTNLGTIQLNSIGNDTRLNIVPELTLTGGGIVQIGGNPNNSILGGSSGFTIANDTIQGSGPIGDGNMLLSLGSGGTIVSTGGVAMSVNTGGNAVTNAGLLEAAGPGGLNITGSGGVANNGTLWANGDGLFVAGSVSGTGSDRITGATTLRIGGTVSAGQSVSFDPGSTGTLRLDDSRDFRGTVFGLATNGSNALDLSDISFINSTTTMATYNGGTLTVTDGTHTAAIALAGNFTGQTFVTSSDGHNGTTVIDPAAGADAFAATLLGSYLIGGAISPPVDNAIAGCPLAAVAPAFDQVTGATDFSWTFAIHAV
jgi:hypothetical protein